MKIERHGTTAMSATIAVVLVVSAACVAQTPARQSPPSAPDETQPSERAGAPAIAITRPSPGAILISANAHPRLLYQWANTPRPHVHELYTPAGIQLLLDAPPDHVHHHGLMFAVAVNGVDFWAEDKNTGHEIDLTKAGPTAHEWEGRHALIEENLDWMQKDKKLLIEIRAIRIDLPPAGVNPIPTLATWRSRLEPAQGVAEAQLTGSHYFGLGLRFVRGMDKNGKFINSDNADGEVVRGDEKLYPGRWCAYTATLDGKPVTVAMFNDPKNIRPATWFTMADPFAYLSATLKLHKEPLTLKAGQTLDLTYGIAAWDGAIARDQIEKCYAQWLEALPKAPATAPAGKQPEK